MCVSKLLLVEGPTDVRAVRQLLRLFGKAGNVALAPLAGGQLIKPDPGVELAELQRIAPDVLAMIDSEKTSADRPLKTDRAGFVAACKDLHIPCLVTERRALENYLSDRAVKKLKGSKYRALGPFESLKEMNPHWEKTDNWLIAQEMVADELADTDLGKFLAQL